MQESSNPYTVSFNEKPKQFINRSVSTENILNMFLADEPSSQIYIITGVRGSGKTELLADIVKQIKNEPNWIVIDLDAKDKDMLTTAVAELYDIEDIYQSAIDMQLDLSFIKIGTTIERGIKITDKRIALRKLFEIAKKKNQRVLFTIDEVANTESIQEFISQFQILYRNENPIFLLMTGLYENINKIQDGESLTFLYRAPKEELTPLNFTGMASSYEHVLNIPENEALDMARKTNGYPFAFQLLGYYTWEKQNHNQELDIMTNYRVKLEEYSYKKIWSETSQMEKKILIAMAINTINQVSEIQELTNLQNNKFSVYRKRLLNKGILYTEGYGQLWFTLPYFAEFVKTMA